MNRRRYLALDRRAIRGSLLWAMHLTLVGANLACGDAPRATSTDARYGDPGPVIAMNQHVDAGAGPAPGEAADSGRDNGLDADGGLEDKRRDGSMAVPDGGEGLDAATPEPSWAELPPLDGLQVSLLEDDTTSDGAPFQLLRLQHPGRAATYAQFYPPASGTRRPAVVVTKPYAGIDFSGEEVDMRWAALGNGFHPDLDGPNAGDAPGGISYTLADPTTTDDGSLFRLHDMGVLLVYGRYYAGGDVQNDIDDMVTGLDYLATNDLVDRNRIGIWGGSWGGFEALYGAAYARDIVQPRVGAALSPLSDFARQVNFVQDELPARYTLPESRAAASTFFDPYLRRIEPTRAARGGLFGLQASDLAERIRRPFLLVHDDWDTLVSFEQSQALYRLAPTTFAPLWLQHPAPPPSWDAHVNGHGPLLTQFQNAAVTFLLTFLLVDLADDGQAITTLWDVDNMRALSQHMLSLQRLGLDMDFYAARLQDLADPRVTVRSWDNTASLPGPDMVAAEVNAVWGTTYEGSTIADALDQGLPPPGDR